ncbi:formyltetrahydrofolate-dependent phosphoribosylglycinamide formyltransferase [Alkalispirillum mobile]|uniref:Phosphoribosylglycinamide formyltransferase n=1 Tax=Alkalispirillum mobile TaxID=85925 RepID=A0A498C826_9GAMM|nr:phosphoribosylglycinamide formyltransferase [Alkalispirillum mobile]RLK51239.1 formyltetrahydrofolate-dependent phosphoribosylglycinamide formyltransferase [Alkalispirillum mobile]
MSGGDGRQPLPVVVLISGSGSNLQTFIDGQASGELPIEIKAVISNKADAFGLERARKAGIPARVLSHRDFEDRAGYDRALAELIDGYAPGLLVLAGFMRILSDAFVAHYEGRLINIHPSLLPDFRGLHTHERALESGVQVHGCSVHFVIPELDAGPLIVQAEVPVQPEDTPETLAKRVQVQEHRIYPLAVRWLAEGRVCMRDGRTWMDGQPLEQTPRITAETRTETL